MDYANKIIIIIMSLSNYALLSQSINKLETNPVFTHQFSPVNFTRLSEISSLSKDARFFSTPLLTINSAFANPPNAINLNLRPEKTIESGLNKNVQPKQVDQARNIVKKPGNKRPVNPKISREKQPNANDNPLGIFNVEISSNSGMATGELLGSVPSGFSFILNTPLGFEFGKNKFTLSIISGSYFYSRESKFNYSDYWDTYSYSYEENITSSFTGIGGKYKIGEFALLEGHFGQYKEETDYMEGATESKGNAFNVLAGFTSSWLTGRKNYLLIGPEFFYFNIGDQPSYWMGTSIRLALGFDQILYLIENVSNR